MGIMSLWTLRGTVPLPRDNNILALPIKIKKIKNYLNSATKARLSLLEVPMDFMYCEVPLAFATIEV